MFPYTVNIYMYLCIFVTLTFFIVVVANNYKVISEPGHLCCRCTLLANLGLVMGLGLLLLLLPLYFTKSTK